MYSNDWYKVRGRIWGRKFLWMYVAHSIDCGYHYMTIDLWQCDKLLEKSEALVVGSIIVHCWGLLPLQVELLSPPTWLLQLLGIR